MKRQVPVSTLHNDHRQHQSPSACNWNCIQEPYRRFLYRYGRFVGRHPWWFVVIPPLVCLAFTSGVLAMKTFDGGTNLYTPKDSVTMKNKHRIIDTFPVNSTWEAVPHASLKIEQATIIGENINGNILNEQTLSHLLRLDHYIKNNITTASGKTYQDLCGSWHGECVSRNPLFTVLQNDASNVNKMSITLPFTNILGTTQPVSLDGIFADTSLAPDSKTLQSARYMAWIYYLREDLPEETDDWLVQLNNLVEDEVWETPEVKVWIFSVVSINQELQKAAAETLPQFIIALVLTIVFSIVTCLMVDPVRSKPLLAISGVLSPAFALGAGLGILFLAGQPFAITVGLVPFLIIAIGVDGMFVMLSAWRHTSPYATCEERMALTFQEGGVSVTITALTDILGMAVGVVNPFIAVELFCRFATLAAAIDLVMQLTFFGGCMALAGRREGANRHSLLPCKKVPAPSQARNSGCCTRLLCTGGVNKAKKSPLDNKEHLANKIFGKHIAKWTAHPVVIVLGILVYFAYVGGAVYGCFHIKEGLRKEDIALEGSKYQEMIKIFTQNYESYTYMMLVIDEPLTYSNVSDQQKVFSLITELSESDETTVKSSFSWLHSYLEYLKQQSSQPVNEADFIFTLQNSFFKIPEFDHYKVDLAFSSNNDVIEASRLYLLGNVFNASDDGKSSFRETQRIMGSHELNAFVYNTVYQFTEQYILILPVTLQMLGIASAAMLIVSILFLPNPLIALFVASSIVSIELGLIGYSSLLGVRMDIIAMMCMLISVGFVVDFSAHLAYVFVSNKRHRLDYAMSLTGFPLVQSSLSTFVGIFILSFSRSAISRTFFKLLALLMAFGTIHGLLWLPIIIRLSVRCTGLREWYRRNSVQPTSERKRESFSRGPFKSHKRPPVKRTNKHKHFPDFSTDIRRSGPPFRPHIGKAIPQHVGEEHPHQMRRYHKDHNSSADRSRRNSPRRRQRLPPAACDTV